MIDSNRLSYKFLNKSRNQNKNYKFTFRQTGVLVLTGCFLLPTFSQAKPNTQTQKLLEQMEEYKRQLQITNKRLQELEEKETVKSNGYIAGSSNPSQYTNSGEPTSTRATKLSNLENPAYSDEQFATNVPKSQFLSGYYDKGFTLRTNDNRYSLTINGLAQARYSLFLPSNNLGKDSQTFDLALGRLFFSGTVFDPNLSYFFFYQTSTLANTNRVDTIDWWGKYQLGNVGIKAGRILPQYSRQFYTDIGKYLFQDLQAPEYAFSLQRTPGVEVVWQAGKWTASLTAGNSVRALDSDTQQNATTKIAGIGRIVYDVLEPYNYVQETIPDIVDKPQLSLGAAFGFNPIDVNSRLQNTIAGTDTFNSTVDIGYRYKKFSTEGAFFWRHDDYAKNVNIDAKTGDNYGWYWQAGYYLLPKRLELAGTANQVVFDHPFGSNFKNQTVGSVGLNYYFYNHNFKLQADYSYITGEDWANNSFNESRLRLQGQVYF